MLKTLTMRVFRLVNKYIKRVNYNIKISSYIGIVCLFFVGYVVFNSIDKLIDMNLSKVSIYWLLIGVFISLLSLFINAIAWKELLIWLGYRPKNIDIVSLFLSSNIMKYLPGGIWHFVERLRVLRPQIKLGSALTSVVLEPLLMVASALLFVPLSGLPFGLSLLCILPSLLFVRYWREPLLRRLEKLKISQIKKVDTSGIFSSFDDSYKNSRKRYPFKPLFLEMLFIIFRFFGFWCCLKAFSIQSSLSFQDWLAIFSFSWTVGLVIPGAPGGIGVFETVLLLLLGSFDARATLVAVLLCYRLISTFSDLLGVAFVQIKKTWQKT